MLIQKNSPEGIDWYIQKLQTAIHSQLLTSWGLSADQYQSYARCYRNRRNNGYVAEVYDSGKEYKEVYWNDTLSAMSFFGIGQQIQRGIKSEADIHLVFFVDLSKLSLTTPLGAAVDGRGDEEARNDVLGLIGRSSNGFTVTSVDLGIENVLREYPGSIRDERLRNIDMHPIHCFRINTKLLFDPNKIC